MELISPKKVIWEHDFPDFHDKTGGVMASHVLVDIFEQLLNIDPDNQFVCFLVLFLVPDALFYDAENRHLVSNL